MVAAPTMRKPVGPVQRVLPTLIVTGTVALVGTYIYSQLSNRKQTFDKIFSQQNTPEVEEHRRQQLQVDIYGDPRRTAFNALGWSK